LVASSSLIARRAVALAKAGQSSILHSGEFVTEKKKTTRKEIEVTDTLKKVMADHFYEKRDPKRSPGAQAWVLPNF
jgi:hypothetical protein